MEGMACYTHSRTTSHRYSEEDAMLDAATHLLAVLFGLLTIALGWYYRLMVAPRIPPKMAKRMPSYLRAGAVLNRTAISLSFLFGLVALVEFVMFLGQEPGYRSSSILAGFAAIDILIIGLLIRVQRRIGRSV
jgi:hypothetical protein